MALFWRLTTSIWLFGSIFVGYIWHWCLVQLFRVPEETGGYDAYHTPEWLVLRRERMEERYAERLYLRMLQLRGVYIKLGQVLSVMGGAVPRVYATRLEKLQDQVPPRPFSEVEEAFIRSLKRTPGQCFRDLDEKPIAAASLGQVHVAHLHDGSKVAVKILYPGIRDLIRIDMRVVRIALHVYQWFIPVQNLSRAHDALVDLLRRETDYRIEGRCMTDMAANFSGDPQLLFPEVVPELSSADVLTMTFMEGSKITDFAALERLNVDRRAVAELLVKAFYQMLLVDRLFHADPHPGNFLIQATDDPHSPRLVVLDFGSVSTVGHETVEGLIDVLQGYFEQQEALVFQGIERIGFAAPGADRDLLEQTVKTYFTRLLRIEDTTPQALMDASPDELQALVDPELERAELRRLMKSVQYPEGWFYVERASVLLFWLCAQIDPKLDTVQAGFPHVLPLLANRTESLS